MRRLLPFALFFAAACGDASSELGQSEHDIVGGEPTASFPAVGAVTYYGQTACTGTLIAPRKVLLAAHCLDDYPANALAFSLGARTDAPSEVIPVQHGVKHPYYDRATLANDIAYLVLAHAPTTTSPAALVPALNQSFVGEDLVFVGYGYDDGINETGEGIKRSVTIPMAKLEPKTFTYSTRRVYL